MPRGQRIRSKSGYYHIMLRGNEKKNIFLDDEDKQRFLEIINEKKIYGRFKLHAYCLMDNHVHLLICEGTEEIFKVMKRITVSFVYYFNKKYKRVGHLFQDRYRSETVEGDNYLLALTRYIHQNPVKAGMVENPKYYKWSSFNMYIEEKGYLIEMLDKDIILEMLSSDAKIAKLRFIQFMSEESNEKFIDLQEKAEIVDDKEIEMILEKLLNDLKMGSRIPDDQIREFKQLSKFSNRAIATLTGINKEKINKIIKCSSIQ